MLKWIVVRVVGLIAAVSAAACASSSGGGGGGGSSAQCGDGVCAATETAATCPADCSQQSGGAVCGNGKCEFGESSANCAADCKAACQDECNVVQCSASSWIPCDVGTDGCKHRGQPQACAGGQVCSPSTATHCAPCVTNVQCEGNTVCSGGACTNANGATYVFTIESATVPATTPNGSEWDSIAVGDYTLPDPYLCVELDGVQAGCTTKGQQDTTSPIWNQTIEAKVYTNQTVSLVIYDDDGGNDDEMSGTKWQDTVALVKSGGGGWNTADTGYKVNWTVKPK